MFIRVKSKITGHEFDIHEHQFSEEKHARVRKYPPSRRPRRTKHRIRAPRTQPSTPAEPEKEETDVSDHP